jgi:alkylhydroperoxidase family enzyme
MLLCAFAPASEAAAGKGSYTLFVLNEPAEGVEAEFNRWYDQQHAQDVLINPTYVDSQRYVASASQLHAGSTAPNKYAIRFTIVSDDIARSLGYIGENIRSGRTVQTDTIARGKGRGGDFVYRALGDVKPGRSAARASGKSGPMRRFLQMQFAAPAQEDAAAFNRRYDTALAPKLAALPGVISVQRFELSPRQLTTKMNIAERYMTLIELQLPDTATIDTMQKTFTALEDQALGNTGKVMGSFTYEHFGPLLAGADVKRERAKAAEAARPGAGLSPTLRASAYIDPPGSTRPVPPTRPRLAPLADKDLDPEKRAAIEHFPAQEGNALRTLAISPPRANQFFPLFNYIENNSALPARDRELLILRTAWLTQNAYLWARHAQRAAQAGLTPSDIRMAASRDSLAFGSFDAVLLTLADELFRNTSVSSRTWSAVTERYGTPRAMDAVVTVTHMTEAGILFNTLGVQPDETTTARLPSDIPYALAPPAKEPALSAARVQPLAGTDLAIRLTLRQNPELAAQWYATPETETVNGRQILPPHDRELAILRMGWNCQAVYEWAQHVGRVGRAREQGLEPRDIAVGVAASGWSERDRTLITAVDEMYRDSTVSDATWRRLTAIYDNNSDGLLAFIARAARYRRVSMTLNALGVQPAADEERLPDLSN